MKLKITYFCLLFLLWGLCTQAQTALEYYVDGAQTTNGNGTAASPWNKIWYAINRTRDTTKDAIVYIKADTYTISISISK